MTARMESDGGGDSSALGELLLTDVVETSPPSDLGTLEPVVNALLEDGLDREAVFREEARAWLDRNGARVLGMET